MIFDLIEQKNIIKIMKSKKKSLKNNSFSFFFNFKLKLFIFLNNKKSNPEI